MTIGPALTPPDIGEKLSEFKMRHHYSSVTVSEKGLIVENPWGDETLEIVVSDAADRLLSALNNVVLPAKFSAIYHNDERSLEFIYAAIPDAEKLERKFIFRFAGKEHECCFDVSSDRLLAIAEATRPIQAPTATAHRLLPSYWRWLHMKKKNSNLTTKPTSFWIRNLDWDETAIIEFANNLNFFMLYFHRLSPLILIHDDSPSEKLGFFKAPYPAGPFPEIIAGKTLDPYLLGLWRSTVGVDSFRRFLHNYQILEYASFYHMQESVSQVIRKVLLAPETPSRVNEAARAIFDAMSDARMDDEAKLTLVVKQLVDPELLWQEIAARREYFSSEVQFDGGFSLPALLKTGWDLEDFKAAWIPKFPDCLRKIRNALVHSREARISRCIAPTDNNHELLRPWAALATTTSMQIILYMP